MLYSVGYKLPVHHMHDQQLCSETQKSLKLKIIAYQKLVSKQKFRIAMLKKKNINVLKKDQLFQDTIKNNFILQTQLRLSQVKKRGLRYKENEKLFALSLDYSSPKSYKFMRKRLCQL